MMLPVEQASAGLGFDRVSVLHGSTYADRSTVIVCPTRGMIHSRVVQAWQNMIAPMNQKRAWLFASGDEVGVAYNKTIQAIRDNPELASWRYLMTVEDDNLVPVDAHIRLLEAIEEHRLDAVSGIYWTKGDYNMPMAYGDAGAFAATGVLSFAPIDIRAALERGQLVEVNGIGMGCALWRMELFREMAAPWFVTVNDVLPDKGPACFTQDLWFCERARRAGKRIGVDMRVRVGHLDVASGLVY